MQVVCRSLPELEYHLFLSIPSHTVEALDFKSKVEPGNKREGNEISETSDGGKDFTLTAVVLLAVVSQNRQYRKASKLSLTLPPYTSTNARSSALIKSSFFQRIGIIKYFGMLLQL